MKDLLKYYIALQPHFKKVMGEWRPGDNGYYIPESYPFLFVFDSARTADPGSDSLYSVNTLLVKNSYMLIVSSIKMNKESHSYLRIPRTVDDSGEEARSRSLVGMLDGIARLTIDKEGALIEVFDGVNNRDPQMIEGGETTTEAILKALCVQWNVGRGSGRMITEFWNRVIRCSPMCK